MNTVIPINRVQSEKDKLRNAVGVVLARVGFEEITPDMVAHEADLTRKQLFRHYGGLENLVSDFSESGEFWPDAKELIGDDIEEIRAMGPAEILAEFFQRYLRGILKRPLTLGILGWEAVQRNNLTRGLESVRVKCALEFFEHMQEDPPEDVDITAVVLLLAGAVNFLAVRSRLHGSLGGIDLRSDNGWCRIEKTIRILLKRTIKSA